MPVPSPFHARTSALCVSQRFKDWAGFLAVCSYESSHEAEYFAFRNATGLLDASPLFKYEVSGADAAEFLAFVTTRDIRKLGEGRVTYGCLCDEDGKLIDDGTVARLPSGKFRVTTASPAFRWLDLHCRGFEVEVRDVTESTAALAVQGPTSAAVLGELIGNGIEQLRFFGIAGASVGGIEVEISRTGYTGDLGYEVWVPAGDALQLWDLLVGAGAVHGLRPAGLDALDVTRIEAGFVLQGVDYFSAPRCLIDARKSTPYEAGLGWTVTLDREPFVGQTALVRERDRGRAWQLVGLEISWDAIESLYDSYGLPPKLPSGACRDGVPVYDGRGQVGQATSSTWSPILKKYLALATLRSDRAKIGEQLEIEHTVEYERRRVLATVVDRPFFDPERKRA